MSTLIQDLRYAARMLPKAPGFAVVAIAIPALGTGARCADILKMLLGEAAVMVCISSLAGILSPAPLTRFLNSLLTGVGSHEPATLISVSLTLVGFTLFASYVPARRAMRVDPMVALRTE